MKDLSGLKLDLTPEVLRNASDREKRTIPFPDESQEKEETGENK